MIILYYLLIIILYISISYYYKKCIEEEKLSESIIRGSEITLFYSHNKEKIYPMERVYLSNGKEGSSFCTSMTKTIFLSQGDIYSKNNKAIYYHELGHRVFNHGKKQLIYKLFIESISILFFISIFINIYLPIIGIMILIFKHTILDFISRCHEVEADLYARSFLSDDEIKSFSLFMLSDLGGGGITHPLSYVRAQYIRDGYVA